LSDISYAVGIYLLLMVLFDQPINESFNQMN